MKLIYITKTNKFYSFANQHFAQVAELVDALDSKSSFFGSVGSIPTLSTFKTAFPSWLKVLRFFFDNQLKNLLKHFILAQ